MACSKLFSSLLVLFLYYSKATATTGLPTATEPCASARSIHETERRYVLYQFDRINRESSVCDRVLTPGWYRLRDEDIPTISPPIFSCGTTYPVWLKGTIPSDADGIVNRTACRHDNSGTCSQSYEIKVKSCVTHRVYYLVPTVTCDEAYCFGMGTDVAAPALTVAGLVVRPYIHKEQRTGFLMNGFSTPHLQFSCDFTPSSVGSLYYQIYWFKQYGVERYWQYTRVPVKKENLTDTHFLESELGNLNRTIRCGVRLKSAVTGRLSPLTWSSDFFAGVKILTPRVTVGSDGTANVSLVSTVPFGCVAVSTCSMYIEMHLPATCSQMDISNARYCGITLSSTSWNHTHYMTAKAMVGNRRAGTYHVMLKTIMSLDHALWSNVDIGTIQVTVHAARKKMKALTDRSSHSAQEFCTCPYNDNSPPPVAPSPVVNCDASHVVTC